MSDNNDKAPPADDEQKAPEQESMPLSFLVGVKGDKVLLQMGMEQKNLGEVKFAVLLNPATAAQVGSSLIQKAQVVAQTTKRIVKPPPGVVTNVPRN